MQNEYLDVDLRDDYIYVAKNDKCYSSSALMDIAMKLIQKNFGEQAKLFNIDIREVEIGWLLEKDIYSKELR